jgi:hypothetical protein
VYHVGDVDIPGPANKRSGSSDPTNRKISQLGYPRFQTELLISDQETTTPPDPALWHWNGIRSIEGSSPLQWQSVS